MSVELTVPDIVKSIEALTITSGDGTAAVDGSDLNIIGGDGGATDGTEGGTITITPGTSSATNGDGGSLILKSGSNTGTGTGGTILAGNDTITNVQESAVATWVTQSSAADNAWNDVTWSPELSLFVAVSLNGTGDRVMTSPDGITWTTRTSTADNQWESVTWSPELSLFVAVSSSGTER